MKSEIIGYSTLYLCDCMGLMGKKRKCSRLIVYGGSMNSMEFWLEKSKTHKYISKEMVNGQWVYEYPKTNNDRRVNTANQIKDVIIGINPLLVDRTNAKTIGFKYLNKISQYLAKNDVRAKWLQKRRVSGIDIGHLTNKKGRPRSIDDVIQHTKFLPFVLPIIKKHGHVSKFTKDNKGRYSYELVGKVKLANKKLYTISVILREYEPGKGLELEHRSVFGFTNNMIKSLATADSQRQAILRSPFSPPTTSRYVFGKATSSNDRLALIISDISIMSIEKQPPAKETRKSFAIWKGRIWIKTASNRRN